MRKPNLPLTPEQQGLVEANTGLVGWAMKRYTADAVNEEYDEAKAYLVDGLIRAAQLYQHGFRSNGREVKFCTYAGYWLFQAAQKWRKDRSKRLAVGSVSLSVIDGDGSNWDEQQAAATKPHPLEGLADKEMADRWRRWLPEPVWRAFWLRVGLGLEYREVASTEGVSKQAIQQRVNKAIRLIRKRERLV